jgi:hypothetical protein
MRRNFWKAVAISLAAYAGALTLGYLIDFRVSLFSLLAVQITWTLFCVVRVVQLRLRGAHSPAAQPFEREDYEFAAGGSISSIVLLVVMVILTQAV